MRMTEQTYPTIAAIRPVHLSRAAAIIPLVAILALQVLPGLSLHNTAFQDEALYLYAGRQVYDQMLGGPAVTGHYISLLFRFSTSPFYDAPENTR